MKRAVLIMFASVVSVMAMAQLYALSMNGNVQIQREGKWQDLFIGDELQKTDIVQTEEFGYIVILDRSAGKKYSFQSTSPQSVDQLILSQEKKSPRLAREVVHGLYNMLRGRGNYPQESKNNTGGVTYRDMDENIIVASILNSHPQTSYAIDFILLDAATLQPTTQVYEGQSIIIQINNHSDTPLYVNFIDKEPNGKQSAVFNANDTIFYQDLYIPPFSSIRLNRRIEFYQANTTDQLILVAYQKPFDLEHVLILPLKETIKQNIHSVDEPIGIYQMNVPILSAGSY